MKKAELNLTKGQNKKPLFFNVHSVGLRITALLILLIVVEAGFFMYSFKTSGILSEIDHIAMQTETMSPMNISTTVRHIIFLAVAFATVAGTIIAGIIIYTTVLPIREFMKAVKKYDSGSPISFKRTGISELDDLADTIALLSSISSETASKMSNVLDAAGRPMAIFEYYEKTAQVYITKNLFPILEESNTALHRTGLIPANVFNAKMAKLDRYLVLSQSATNRKVFHIEQEKGYSKWIRVTILPDTHKTLGLIEDISEEMLNKTKMEFERDYDSLTSLLNRRAFYAGMQQVFSMPEILKVGAMFSIDLDNLKFVNDTYGHAYGDEYIRSMASVLNMTCRNNSIIARLGGDEFAVFMYGYESKEEIRTEIIRLNIAINNKIFKLPDNTQKHLSASAGISWYPSDSTSYTQLIKYADFAMYSVKKSTKGDFSEFIIKDYEKDSELIGMSTYLREFIKKKMFEYTFQPIVNAKNGEIFAYEALIKSKHPAIKTPNQLFELAKSRTELYEIENLTWAEGLKAFEELNVKPTVKLFINSIPDQLLDMEDSNNIKRNFCHILNQVVVEINEAGNANLDYTKAKLDFVQAWGGEIAIGDYSTGSYNEDSLTDITPRYLKVDISITQSLFRDENRLKLVEGLVAFAHQRNIKIIAEGIEKPEDMFALINIGVDYLQGYHIAKPTSMPPKRLAITTAQISNYNKRHSAKAEEVNQQPTQEYDELIDEAI